MTTPTITLLVPKFSIFEDPITDAKSLQFDVNLGANLGSAPTSRLEALSFEMRVSGFPTTGFTVPSDQSTWFTGVNSSLLPGLQLTDLGFTQTAPGVLNLNWGWYTSAGIAPQVDNKLFTVKIPLGSGDNLSQSIFKLEALTPIEAVFESGTTGAEVDTYATLSTGPIPPTLNYSDLFVAPQLTSITSKVGGVTATDGSDSDTALDVKANQDIEVTFTFSKSIDPNSFNSSDLEFNQMVEQISLSPVSGSNNTAFKVTFNPTDMNIWNGSVGIKAGATITGSNNLPLDMTSMPASLQFAGDTAAPSTPYVYLEDMGTTSGGLSMDGVVNKVVLRSTGADYANTQTINYYVDGASSPTASVSGSTTMYPATTLDLADGTHTVRAQAVDVAGNISAMSTAINFTVDTSAPWVSLVESVSSIPGIASPSSGQYFHVRFSENVIQVNPNDFRVLNADGSVNSTATITSFYRGTSGSTDTYTPEDDYYVVVSPSGQTNLSVGVVPVVDIIATTAYSGTPASAAQLDSATQAMLTGGAWVKIDLNNPVASLPSGTGWLTTTSTQAGVTAPWVVATVQDTSQSFYAYVKSYTSEIALDVSKLSFTSNAGGDTGLQLFGASITDIAGNSLKTNHNASFTSTTASTNEGNSGNQTVTVDVSLSGIASSTITVPITVSGTALAGTDYTNTPTSITIPMGSNTGSASFNVVGDTTFESNETVVLTMGTPTGATLGANTTYTHTITNDDAIPTVSFASTTAAADEGISGTQAVTVNASLSNPSSTAVTVPITVSGTATAADFSGAPTSITIAAGSTSGSASFNVVGDTTFESNETVVLTMGTPTGATLGANTTYTHTITNDDAIPTVSFATSAAADEGISGTQAVTVNASLSNPSSTAVTVPITVSGTATAADFSGAPTSITIAAGSTSGSASFNVVGDTTFESNETVVLTMGTPTGATLGANTTYTHTITNDDLDPMLDDKFIINASTSPNPTPTLASNPDFIARPATGIGGFDTLDLSALSSAQPIDVFTIDGEIRVSGATAAENKVYRFDDFDEFVINNAGGVNFYGSDASEVVQLKVASSNQIRLANKPTADLSAETDIVDYSATADAVTVNLGSTTGGFATASKGLLGVAGTDQISGAEGIFGSKAGDTITGGSLKDNLLAGGEGDDTLDGAGGNDILVGGQGTSDILIGGTGKDILIDLDGATLTGGTSKKNQGASGDKDVFVVRNGSTIENFHVAKDGAGLAGRAAASANDTILFNLSVGILSEKLAGYDAAVAGKSTSQLQVELAKIKADIDIRVEPTAAGSDDWAVIASYTGSLHSSTVELARVIVKDMDASVMPASSDLTDVALPDFSLENAMSDKIDELVFSQVSDLLVDNQAINLAVALEATRQGTVRESKNGLMFGDFSLPERIFNPGVGSEKIFGTKGKDTYEFLVQDLKTAAGASTSDAGMDRIVDTGGDDAVAFSNIDLSQLDQLDFAAVKLGRESGHYSLSSNYSQSAGSITNDGGFTWTGHFREGFGMELERITLGDATLAMAEVRYDYDAEGNLLNWTPNQVASAGKDTIMVGGVGRSADASTFVVEKGTEATFNSGIGGDNTQHLYFWDADASDVIDLSDFFADATTARNAVQDSVSPQTSTTLKNAFTIDLNSTQDLMLHFMDTTLSQESLEMMIARATYG